MAARWLPWPRPVPGRVETTVVDAQLQTPLVSLGDTVSILALAAGGLALVARCPEHADCDGVHTATTANLFVVPVGALTTKASALERHVRALTTKATSLDRHASSSLGAASIKVDRVHRGWRLQLRRLLPSCSSDEQQQQQQRGSIVQLVNQMGQLAEWRRQDGAPGAAAAVRSSILQLADGTTQLSSGVVAPRTDADELASEANTPPLQLLLLHAETERRLQRGKRVPSQATEALALAVSLGIHGGAAVPNDKAADIGGLGGAAGAGGGDDSNGAQHGDDAPTPLEQVVASFAAHPEAAGSSGDKAYGSREAQQSERSLLHLAVDVCLDAALTGYTQPVIAHVCVYDGVNREPLTEGAEIQWLPPPESLPAAQPLAIGSAEAGEATDVPHRWTRAVFCNVPHDLVRTGRCFITLQLLRIGPLRDDGADATGQAAAAAAAQPGNAVYARPLAGGIVPIPIVLTRLCNATPHRPAPIELRRPLKNDERAWATLHRTLIAELEREAEHQGRRQKVGGGGGGGADGSPPSVDALKRRFGEDPTAPVLNGLPVVVRAITPSASLAALDMTDIDAMLPVLRPVRWIWRGSARGSVASADLRPDAAGPGAQSPRAAEMMSNLRSGGGSRSRGGAAASVGTSSAGILLVSPALAEPEVASKPYLPPSGPASALTGNASRIATATNPAASPPRGEPHGPMMGLRDELYVTLRRGTFAQDKKVSARNVQIRVTAVLESGQHLPCLWRSRPSFRAGDGKDASDDAVSELRSAVFYHSNTPEFNETMTVVVPAHSQLERTHLLFTMWHASSTESKSHMFAFAFLPLCSMDGTCLRDGRHVLRTYKPVAKLGAVSKPPWYLVAPVVDAAGAEVLSAVELPVGTAATAYNDAIASTLGIAWAGGISPAHAAASRLRNLPLTAVPSALNPSFVPSSADAMQAVYRRYVQPGTTVAADRGQFAGNVGGPLLRSAFIAGRDDETDAAAPQSTGSRFFQAITGAFGGMWSQHERSASESAARTRRRAGSVSETTRRPASVSRPRLAWEEPIEIRSDTLEVETRLVSVFRSSVPGELHWLQQWPVMPYDVLFLALGQLPKLMAEASLCLRLSHMLMESLLELLPSMYVPLMSLASGSNPIAGRASAGYRPATFEVQARSISDATSKRQKLLVAAFRLWILLFDRSFSVTPPASAAISKLPAVATEAAAVMMPDSRSFQLERTRSFADVKFGASNAASGSDPDETADVSPPAQRSMTHPAPEYDRVAELEAFLGRRMNAPFAYHVLLRCTIDVLEAAATASPSGKIDVHASEDVAADTAAVLSAASKTASAAGVFKCQLPLRAAVQLSRSLDMHLRVAIHSFQQHAAHFQEPSERVKALVSFRALCSELLSACLFILRRPVDECPVLLVGCKASILRQFPAMCSQLYGAVMSVDDVSRVLISALQSVEVCDWRRAAVASVASTAVSVRMCRRDLYLSHSLFIFYVVERFVSVPSSDTSSGTSRSLPPARSSSARNTADFRRILSGPVTQALLFHLNGDNVRRVIALAVVARLAALINGTPLDSKQLHLQPGLPHSDSQSLLRWHLSAMLSELSIVVADVCRDRSAPGSFLLLAALEREKGFAAESGRAVAATPGVTATRIKEQLLWLNGEQLDVLACFKTLRTRLSSGIAAFGHLRLPLPAAEADERRSGPPPTAAQQAEIDQLKADLAVLPDRVFDLVRDGLSLPETIDRIPCHSSIVKHESSLKQMAVATLIAVVSAIPDQSAPFLLATVSPVRHTLISLGGVSSVSDRGEELEIARLAFALQLLHAATDILHHPQVPPSWVPFHVAAHSFALRCARWVARFLAACYSRDCEPCAPATLSGGWRAALPVWSSLWRLLTALVTSPIANAEALPPARRTLVLQLCGDRRPAICALMRSTWGGALEEAASSPLGAAGVSDSSGGKTATTGGSIWRDLDAQEYADATGATAVTLALRGAVAAPGSQAAATANGGRRSSVQSMAHCLCPALRLALADKLVATCLDLTHSPSAAVSGLARDLYLDCIRAEVSLGGADAGGLPVVERLTIDAVDILVARRGPTLTSEAWERVVGQRRRSSNVSGMEVDSLPPLPARISAVGRSPPASDNLVLSLFSPVTLPVTVPVDAPDASPTRRASVSAPPVAPDALLWHPAVNVFLSEIRTLYAMLWSVSRFPPTPRFEAERTAAALTLVAYLRRSHRTDLYTKYVAFVCDLHKQLGNAAEAALAFLLHADILSWSPEVLPAVRTPLRELFPAQSAASRLECVLLSGVDRLAAAQCWEEAVALCDVLARRYERVTGEYSKLAAVCKRRAALVASIAHVERVQPAYFAVFFRGTAFPDDVRGRCFVFRGSRGERLADFEERLLAKWPGARKAALDLSPFVQQVPAGAGTCAEVRDVPPAALADTASTGLVVPIAPAAPMPGAAAAGSGAGAAPPRPPPPLMDLSFAAVVPVRQAPMHPLHQFLPPSALLPPPSLAATAASPAASALALALLSGAATQAPAPWVAPLDPAPTPLPPPAPRGIHELLYSLVARPADGAAGAAQILLRPPSGDAVVGGSLPPPPWHAAAPLPAVIRQGAIHAGARTFLYTRTFRKRAAKSGLDFLDQWHALYYASTAEAFPCARRRVPVVHVREFILNPMEAAVLALQEKNASLSDATERAMAGADGAAPQSFTAALQGVIDPVISGGLANYRPFFDGSYRASHPEIAEDMDADGGQKAWVEQALRDAVAEQLAIAARGVRVHGRKCAPNMLPLHDFLVSRFGDLLRQAAGLGAAPVPPAFLLRSSSEEKQQQQQQQQLR